MGLCALSGITWAADDGSKSSFVKPLDGVPIEAVETYASPRANQLSIGMGYFPFNPYYNGLSLSAGYIHRFGQNFSWEILHADYIYAFQKGLTTELADTYGVDPKSIETLKYMISTNMLYTFAYGKFVLFGDFIRYFRASVLLGGGLVQTSLQSGIGVNAGFRLDVYTSETFSWQFEFRNSTTVNTFDNNASFTLGPSVNF